MSRNSVLEEFRVRRFAVIQDVDRTPRRSRTTTGQNTVEKQPSLQPDVGTSRAQLGEIRFAASELFASDMHGSLGTKPALYRHTSTS